MLTEEVSDNSNEIIAKEVKFRRREDEYLVSDDHKEKENIVKRTGLERIETSVLSF